MQNAVKVGDSVNSLGFQTAEVLEIYPDGKVKLKFPSGHVMKTKNYSAFPKYD